MANILETYYAATIADSLLDVIDDLGYNVEESIPGLLLTVERLAHKHPRTDRVLDEATELLADGVLTD
jgi:hypothetical protein